MHREFATGFRRTRPRRSIFFYAHGGDTGNRYPCLACRGQGRIDDSANPPWPVSGKGTKKPAAKRRNHIIDGDQP